jgi:protein O-GlcNAc transferase
MKHQLLGQINMSGIMSTPARPSEHEPTRQLRNAPKLTDDMLPERTPDTDTLFLRGKHHAERGDPDLALAFLDQAIAARPDFAVGRNARGVVLGGTGRTLEALADFEAAVSAQPNFADAWCNRGIALWRLKRLEQAVTSYDRALQLCPAHSQALLGRGLVLLHLHRPEPALDSFVRLLDAEPDHVEAWVAHSAALKLLNRKKDSIESLQRALAAQPDHPRALTALGTSLLENGNAGQALQHLDRALALAPGSKALALLANRANALQVLGRFREADKAYQDALEVLPDSPDIWFAYARFLMEDVKRPNEASAAFARVAVLRPDQPDIAGFVLHTKMQACDWTHLNARITAVTEAIAAGHRAATPFICLSLTQSAALHVRCALTALEGQYPNALQAPWRPGRHERGPENRNLVRLAYVSADFRNHPTTHLLTELIESHDRARFEVIGVSLAPDDGSAAGRRIRGAFDRYIDVSRLDDAEACDRLRSVGADIAIDLMGHTRLSRFALFMQRPAPIQVQYIGHPVFGARCMDYIIADRVVVPPEHEVLLPDNVVCLPDTMQVNDRRRPISAHTPTRIEAGLPERGCVFCCFNTSFKLTPTFFDIWMRLLRVVDGSVLWLLEDSPVVSRNLRAEASARGVSPDRLVFAPRVQLPEHLARHRLADLFLDTLPVNACTTASDALWAGVPVVTCLGESFTARVCASLLNAIRLPELITRSLSEYEAVCLHLARSPQRLMELRRRLTQQRDTTPLFDSSRYRRHIESAYAMMWERHENGQPPKGFSVPISA